MNKLSYGGWCLAFLGPSQVKCVCWLSSVSSLSKICLKKKVGFGSLIKPDHDLEVDNFDSTFWWNRIRTIYR